MTTGISYNGRVEVISGIDENDMVITTGYQNIAEGDEIAVSEEK